MEQLSLLDLSLEQAIMQHYQDFLFNDDLASFLNNNGFSGLTEKESITSQDISNFILVNFRGV